MFHRPDKSLEEHAIIERCWVRVNIKGNGRGSERQKGIVPRRFRTLLPSKGNPKLYRRLDYGLTRQSPPSGTTISRQWLAFNDPGTA